MKFVFTPAMATVARNLLAEFSAPPTLVLPDCDSDASRPSRIYCDASINGFGATLEQEQLDGSIRRIVLFSRATLESQRNWTPLDRGAGGIVWSINTPSRISLVDEFSIFSDH